MRHLARLPYCHCERSVPSSPPVEEYRVAGRWSFLFETSYNIVRSQDHPGLRPPPPEGNLVRSLLLSSRGLSGARGIDKTRGWAKARMTMKKMRQWRIIYYLLSILYALLPVSYPYSMPFNVRSIFITILRWLSSGNFQYRFISDKDSFFANGSSGRDSATRPVDLPPRISTKLLPGNP